MGKTKGGNKRLQLDEETSTKPKVNVKVLLEMVRDTECIEELIELSRCDDPTVRLKAVQ
jgi:hypothetical protein